MCSWIRIALLSGMVLGCNPGVRTSDAGACAVATCEGDIAATCDRSAVIDCSRFGGTCLDFIGADDEPFRWCGCGSLASGRGVCLSETEAVICEGPIALPTRCPPGSRCGATSENPEGIGCFCDDLADGLCPDPGCTTDPDCCVGSCEGRSCGTDGCSGWCGTCASGDTCSDGSCVACAPSCDGLVCGSDGCGGSCGGCPPARSCSLDRTRCLCGASEIIEYRFTSAGVDWSEVESISLSARHIAQDGARSETRTALLDGSRPIAILSFRGCEPHIEIFRTYVVRAGACIATDVVAEGEVAIPAPLVTDSGCTAPPL